MKDFRNEERLFDTADGLARLARDRRVAAIDANARLAWCVRLQDDQGGDLDLLFSTSPDFPAIERAARKHGICGQVHIREVTVRAIKARPLLLMPWHRARHPATNIGE